MEKISTGCRKKTCLNTEHPYYVEVIPVLRRPTSGSLTRPSTKEEKLYCWFFWLEAIQDPARTGEILEQLEYIPEFNVPWGKHFKYSTKLAEKRYK